jgi:hypothetical protein
MKEVLPVLKLCHENILRREGRAPGMLNVSSTQGFVVSFTPGERNPYILATRQAGHKNCSDVLAIRKILAPAIS